jgi:DNA-binding HxlR family transcriptional regulator
MRRMSYQTVQIEFLRRDILKSLAESVAGELNEELLRRLLEHQAHHVLSDELREHAEWLAKHGAIKKAQIGATQIYQLTELGYMLARGKKQLAGVYTGLGSVT